MGYIKIEGVEFAKNAGTHHTLTEFKRLHAWLKEPEKAYKSLGGTISKPKAKKGSEDKG